LKLANERVKAVLMHSPKSSLLKPHQVARPTLYSLRIWLAPLLASLFLASPMLAENTVADSSTDSFRSELRRVIRQARDRVFPALVSIRVVTVRYRGGRELKGQSVGSGTIFSPEGYVLTNEHVVRGGRKFVCTLADQREIEATLVGEDPLTDLAVLQLDPEALGASPLPLAEFGDSDALEIGDYVMAMGSPFSLARSVSLGIVSNTERVFAGGFGSDEVQEMELERGQRTGLFTRWIQHDAVISPGNSGGPLVNLAGEVIGVNELGSGPLGFAIPGNLAARVAIDLTRNGEVRRSWIGVSFQPIGRTGLTKGVLISSVMLDGPAERGGVEAGDVLLAIDGEAVSVRFAEEMPLLLELLATKEIGSTIKVELEREGERRTEMLITGELQKDLGDEAVFPAWGITGREITQKMARDLRLESQKGVLVTGLRSGGSAQQAEPPLEPGDVLHRFDQHDLVGLPDLVARYRELSHHQGEPRPLLVEFERRGTHRLTLLEPRREDADQPRELPKAWLGVVTQPLLPHLAEHLGLDVGGFRVARVYPGTEAEKAGLRVGDVIHNLDGTPLQPKGLQDAGLLIRLIRNRDIEEHILLTVRRDGADHELPVVLERTRLRPDEARRHEDGDFEITARELTFFDRDERRWDAERKGVLVEAVDQGGWAGLGGLRPRDLILRIGDTPVRGLKSFRSALAKVKSAQPERVVVVVLRGVRTRFHYLEPEWNPALD
jgi:serine protease Do